jgi:hypothetical protein
MELKELLISSRPAVTNDSIYCESNQTLSLLIPVLRTTFPEARFIWLIRNGLDFVASAMQKQWYSGHPAHNIRYDDSTPTQKAWIDGRLTGARCGVMSSVEWNALSRFAKCCWYWGYVNKLIETNLDGSGADHFFLRLEQIQTQLPKLIAWMGVKADTLPAVSPVNTAKRPPYHWTQWTAAEKLSFTRFCGKQMDRLYPGWQDEDGSWIGVGYETPPQRSLAHYLLAYAKRHLRWIRARLELG